nr:peptidylprolyl isomerase [uncultured Ruminococcus sp.]
MIKTKSARIISLALALMLAFSAVTFSACSGKSTSSTEATKKAETAATAAQVTTAAPATADEATGEVIKAVIDVKDYGVIKLDLYPDVAPKTVANFKKLTESGFYDGLTFHRIMEGFMIQGGDPKGNGTGGSDEEIFGEFTANGFTNNLSHTRGVISMARNSVSMDSASSQFFIVQQDSTFLDGQYASFGKVTEGMEVVDQITKDAKPIDNNGTIPSAQQPVINSITIEE